MANSDWSLARLSACRPRQPPDQSELLSLVANYDGPITKCPTGERALKQFKWGRYK